MIYKAEIHCPYCGGPSELELEGNDVFEEFDGLDNHEAICSRCSKEFDLTLDKEHLQIMTMAVFTVSHGKSNA